MPIAKHELGVFGERIVAKTCECPRCKRSKTLIRLPTNFKCADLICDFCGFLAQVKSATSRDIAKLPNTLLGAALGTTKAAYGCSYLFPALYRFSQCGFENMVHLLPCRRPPAPEVF